MTMSRIVTLEQVVKAVQDHSRSDREVVRKVARLLAMRRVLYPKMLMAKAA